MGPSRRVDRVIVALEDRRGEFPVRELLKLRFNGVVIEEAGSFAGAADRQAASGWTCGPAALSIAKGFG